MVVAVVVEFETGADDDWDVDGVEAADDDELDEDDCCCAGVDATVSEECRFRREA